MPLAAAPGINARAVSTRGDLVIKIQDPQVSRRERLRTLAAREVAQQTGLFRVPEIVSFDDERGEIVFERLPLIGLRQALAQSGRSTELVELAARALAAVHGKMRPAEGASTVQPGSLGCTGSVSVPLHGDFGMRNVFQLAGSNEVAIIDWANADWIGTDADIGPPEIDVTVFLVSFFHRRIFGAWPFSQRRTLARHFLTTYAAASPLGLHIDGLRCTVASLTPAFTRMLRQRKGSLHALGSRHAMIDLDLFLRRISRTNDRLSADQP